jgi:hypothetical protein
MFGAWRYSVPQFMSRESHTTREQHILHATITRRSTPAKKKLFRASVT